MNKQINKSFKNIMENEEERTEEVPLEQEDQQQKPVHHFPS